MLNSSASQDVTYHHEDTSAYEGKFKNDCAALHEAFETYGNPFEEEEPGLVQFTLRKALPNAAADCVLEAFQIGMEQYTKFSLESGSLYDSIKKNKLPLFRKKNDVVGSRKKQETVSMKVRISLLQELFIGCKTRNTGDLSEFFAHENPEYPPSLSEYGHLRHPSSKSDFF